MKTEINQDTVVNEITKETINDIIITAHNTGSLNKGANTIFKKS